MWVQIYQIFKRDQIPIHHLLNKAKSNTDKRIVLNLNEFIKGWKTENKLFIISCNLSQFIVISQSASYITVFFASTQFKFGSIGSLFMINDDLNDELFVYFCLIIKKSRKIRHFSTE
jgi:hypothetical protein